MKQMAIAVAANVAAGVVGREKTPHPSPRLRRIVRIHAVSADVIQKIGPSARSAVAMTAPSAMTVLRAMTVLSARIAPHAVSATTDPSAKNAPHAVSATTVPSVKTAPHAVSAATVPSVKTAQHAVSAVTGLNDPLRRPGRSLSQPRPLSLPFL